ncbi:AAA family ATPase [Rhodococcus kroppenstedtii]|uniref:McrB family protein n=1 Tax=Rhodococcoides kroppenstedtii TaxID=293050 RepID=UPI001C9B51FE|nr:AAA family ATPase [Rhodococcus kroppenstedtii]MBY6438115.1 AAA family ATPase [Rhodococcus kroppenstedtii]
MDVGLEKMSLTRNTTLASLTTTAARLTAGMSLQQVTDIANQNDAESAASWTESLFLFRDGRLVEDAWLRAAKAGDHATANALAWAARVWAEPRIARVVEETLADLDGHFNPAGFSTEVVERSFHALDVVATARKGASTLLNQAAAVPLFVPQKHGPTIVGASKFLPTAQFVPSVIEFLVERIRGQVSRAVAERGDPTELALLWKANRWFGLTKEEFRAAARPRVGVPASTRTVVPPHLRLLHEEAQRRKQVVLQGAPGTGKTYVALQYIDWATGGRRDGSNLSTILTELPATERSPEAVAREVIRRGLSAVWDIAQFHPSYGYEDFVRTLAPVPSANGVNFRAEHRVLSLLSAVATELTQLDSTCDAILIVDEVNRADIARVFGELLYALEYRDAPVRTPYAVEGDASMTIPSNLILLGTMNTADRSIALIDYALRRRFTFITLEPDATVIDSAGWVGTTDREAARRLFEATSTLFTVSDNNAALAIGHSYFLPSGSATTEQGSLALLARRFAYEVVPLLSEYAAEGLVDAAKLAAVLSTLGIDGVSGSQEAVEAELLAEFASANDSTNND